MTSQERNARRLARAQDKLASQGYKHVRRHMLAAYAEAARRYEAVRRADLSEVYEKGMRETIRVIHTQSAMMAVNETRLFSKRNGLALETKFDWSALALRFFEEFGEAYMAQKITRITDTTAARIAAVIRHGTNEGATTPEIAKRIQAIGEMLSRPDAARIARTEVHGMFGYASNRTAEEIADPDLMVREWVSVEDERTRETHDAANGQQQEFGTPFDVGGYALMYPGDPSGPAHEIINCRCVAVTVLRD